MNGTSYEPVIGLEIHAQLRTRTKIFCGCSTDFGAPPNSQVCPVCLGLPGALPVLNRRAVDYAIKAALALGCEVPICPRAIRSHSTNGRWRWAAACRSRSVSRRPSFA